MKKRVLAAIVSCAITASLFAGCAAAGGTAAAPAAPAEAAEAAAESVEEAAEEVTEAAAEAVEEVTETAEAAAEWDGDITEIKVILSDIRGVAEHADHVVAAMNEITESTIGVHADILFVGMGDYATQVGLALASGEQVDICSLGFGSTSFNGMYANGQLTDLTDLLAEEAPGLLEEMGDYIYADSVNGRIYGVPPFRNYASSAYLIMRTDILEELGLLEKAKALTKWSEFEEIMAEVDEKTDVTPLGDGNETPYQLGIIFNGDEFTDSISFDWLGDTYQVVYTDENGVISSLPEFEPYRVGLERVRGWYDKGWIYKDAPTTSDHVDTIMKTGVTFATIQTSEIGVETAKMEATGYPITCVELQKNVVGSSAVSRFGLAVPITAEEPEAAARWLNALYTDPRLENLIVWGLEDTDYVVKDGVAAYPDNVTAANVTYHSVDFMYGNYFNALPWEGNTADFRQVSMDNLLAAPVSPYLGFAINLGDLSDVVAMQYSVNDQYLRTITNGCYTDEVYDNYLAALATADLDVYLAAFQDQLDAWKAANGK